MLVESEAPDAWSVYVYQNANTSDNTWVNWSNNFLHNLYATPDQYHVIVNPVTHDYTLPFFEAHWTASSGNAKGDQQTPVVGFRARLVYNYSDAAADISLPTGTWYGLDETLLGSTVNLPAYGGKIIVDTMIGDGSVATPPNEIFPQTNAGALRGTP